MIIHTGQMDREREREIVKKEREEREGWREKGRDAIKREEREKERGRERTGGSM